MRLRGHRRFAAPARTSRLQDLRHTEEGRGFSPSPRVRVQRDGRKRRNERRAETISQRALRSLPIGNGPQTAAAKPRAFLPRSCGKRSPRRAFFTSSREVARRRAEVPSLGFASSPKSGNVRRPRARRASLSRSVPVGARGLRSVKRPRRSAARAAVRRRLTLPPGESRSPDGGHPSPPTSASAGHMCRTSPANAFAISLPTSEKNQSPPGKKINSLEEDQRLRLKLIPERVSRPSRSVFGNYNGVTFPDLCHGPGCSPALTSFRAKQQTKKNKKTKGKKGCKCK